MRASNSVLAVGLANEARCSFPEAGENLGSVLQMISLLKKKQRNLRHDGKNGEAEMVRHALNKVKRQRDLLLRGTRVERGGLTA